MFLVVGKRLMRTQARDITVCISVVAIDKIKYLVVSLRASSTLDVAVDVSFMQHRLHSSYNSILRLLFTGH